MTGGASSLGRATVERFCRDGAKVILCDINSVTGNAVADKLENCIYVPADVTSEADIRNALDVAKSQFGGLDVAVNCIDKKIQSKIYDEISGAIHSLDDFELAIKVEYCFFF